MSSSRFSVQLIGAAAIPAVRQGTHSAKRPDSLHEHREYLEHAGNIDHKMLRKAMTGILVTNSLIEALHDILIDID